MPAVPPAAVRAALLISWLGGAAFVASLSYFAYFYAQLGWSLQRDAPEFLISNFGSSVASSVAWNATLFTAFALHHSALARTGAKRWLMRWIAPSLERSIYVWIASVLFCLVCVLWTPVPARDVYETTGAAVWIHRGLQALGLVVIAWGASVLDVLELAGIRQARMANPAPEFRVAGPYRWVRHPLYLGWTLIVFGAARMTADRFTFALISTIYLVLAIPWEERSLRETFGEEYDAYRRRVRWKIVPYVY